MGQDIDRLTALEMLRLSDNKLRTEFSVNVQGAGDVQALMVRMMAPVACFKAVQCLWCVHRFCKAETVRSKLRDAKWFIHAIAGPIWCHSAR